MLLGSQEEVDVVMKVVCFCCDCVKEPVGNDLLFASQSEVAAECDLRF